MGWRTHHSSGTSHHFSDWEDEEDTPDARSACGRVELSECTDDAAKKQCVSCRDGIGGRRCWTN